jgi:2-amino-4-hydroxy-6-hydroxymethyldihydropteridine diphosphokinase
MTDPLHIAFVGLGSNLGDKLRELSQARQHLIHAGIQICRTSSIYATEPVGFKYQDWFLNQVLEVRTHLNPHALLQHCLKHEEQRGRMRRIDKGPRPIDLDLLFYEQQVIQEENLVVPHPRLAERRFVLVPLAEIHPDWRHPVLQETVSALLQRCPDTSSVELFHQIC